MIWPLINVYEFIKRHDVINFRDDEDINEFINRKNESDDRGSFKMNEGSIKSKNEWDDADGYNECTVFGGKRCTDFEAIKTIHEALRTIHEALYDIEKNRICKSIMAVTEGIRDTKEGVNNIVRILSRTSL